MLRKIITSSSPFKFSGDYQININKILNVNHKLHTQTGKQNQSGYSLTGILCLSTSYNNQTHQKKIFWGKYFNKHYVHAYNSYISHKHNARLKEKEHKILSYFKRFLFPATWEIRIFPHKLKYKSPLQNVKNVLKKLWTRSLLWIIYYNRGKTTFHHPSWSVPCPSVYCTVREASKELCAFRMLHFWKPNLLSAPSQSVQ